VFSSGYPILGSVHASDRRSIYITCHRVFLCLPYNDFKYVIGTPNNFLRGIYFD